MPRFLATYDIPETLRDLHKAFKEAAREKGWSDEMEIGTEIHKLPETTLAGSFDNIEAAQASFRRAAAAASAKIESKLNFQKWVIVEAPLAVGDSDKKRVRAEPRGLGIAGFREFTSQVGLGRPKK